MRGSDRVVVATAGGRGTAGRARARTGRSRTAACSAPSRRVRAAAPAARRRCVEYARGARERIASFMWIPCEDVVVRERPPFKHPGRVARVGSVAGYRACRGSRRSSTPARRLRRSTPTTSRRSSARRRRDWVRFGVRPWQERRGSGRRGVPGARPPQGPKFVRPHGGPHRRAHGLVLVGRTMTAEVTLSNRDEMGFRMLVGRQALRHGFVVDAGHSFLGGALHVTLRRNRGR